MPRITRVSHTYWDSPRRTSPVVVEIRSERWTDPSKDDQPYRRELEAGPVWSEIDWGWIISPSLVSIVNAEPMSDPLSERKNERREKLRRLRASRPDLDSGSLRGMLREEDEADANQTDGPNDAAKNKSKILEVLLIPANRAIVPGEIKTHPPTLYLSPRESFEGRLHPDVRVFIRSSGEGFVRFTVDAFPG